MIIAENENGKPLVYLSLKINATGRLNLKENLPVNPETAPKATLKRAEDLRAWVLELEEPTERLEPYEIAALCAAYGKEVLIPADCIA